MLADRRFIVSHDMRSKKSLPLGRRLLFPLLPVEEPEKILYNIEKHAPGHREEAERMTYRIFIVEDDPAIAQMVEEQVKAWGLDARRAENFREVAAEFAAYQPHLVLLDISLPFYNGYHWCAEIRKISRVPIVFLSSAADNLNIVMAMNMGADDFIPKPFDRDVLVAKLQAILRRSYDFAAAAPVLEHRGALLDTGDNSLLYQGRRIPLTKNEYRILLTLMEKKGQVVSRERLMERLWETDSFIDDNTLTVNVNRLRKKLDAVGLPGFIATKFGVGYQIQ